MKFILRNMLYKTFFAVILLSAIYGCQTTDNTITMENTERVTLQTSQWRW